MTQIRIATYNINGVVGRLSNLLHWLERTEPDVVCLQELKAPDARFPHEELKRAGYGAVWRGQSAFNGVAIIARGAEPLLSKRVLPGDPADKHSRYIEAAVQGILIGNLYAPNGNPQPGPKFDTKLRWLDRLTAHAAELMATGLPVVLAGDFNIVPTEADIYVSSSWDKDALVQPQSRAAFQALLAQGWTDAVRAVHPEKTIYTFWDYKRYRWQRNAGLRIDHLLISPALKDRLQGATVDLTERGKPGSSDHAPVSIELSA